MGRKLTYLLFQKGEPVWPILRAERSSEAEAHLEFDRYLDIFVDRDKSKRSWHGGSEFYIETRDWNAAMEKRSGVV